MQFVRRQVTSSPQGTAGTAETSSSAQAAAASASVMLGGVLWEAELIYAGGTAAARAGGWLEGGG